MKVLALLSDGYGAAGGIAQYNRDLMAALAQSPHVAGVTALPRYGAASPNTPEKVTQLPPTRNRLGWMLKCVRHALNSRFDVLFCGHLNATPFAALLARATGSALWVQAHGIEAFAPRSAAIQAGLRQARLVTCVSRHTRERLLAWSDVAADRVKVLNNTSSLDTTSVISAAPLFAKLGLADKCVFLTVGRLSASEQYKGHDRVIAALPVVRRTYPNAVYLIVGDGDDAPRLATLARSLGVDEAVVFAGHLKSEALSGVFRAADAFVMPSTGEGFGIVFVEAAASGLPVIGGNRDGSRDALADGAIGAMIDPLNQSELIDAMIGVLEGRIIAKSGEAARFAPVHFARHVDRLLEYAFVKA